MEDFIRERIVDQIYVTNDFDMNLMYWAIGIFCWFFISDWQTVS
jgi:hypothetical protein